VVEVLEDPILSVLLKLHQDRGESQVACGAAGLLPCRVFLEAFEQRKEDSTYVAVEVDTRSSHVEEAVVPFCDHTEPLANRELLEVRPFPK